MSSVARIISKESRKEGIQEKGFFAPARDYAAFGYQARFPPHLCPLPRGEEVLYPALRWFTIP
jgi:hypothetical protein